MPRLAADVDMPAYQTVFCPVLALRQIRSEVPSPLKSPEPAMRQAVFGTLVTARVVDELAERQIVFAPELLLCQTRSESRSPSKSDRVRPAAMLGAKPATVDTVCPMLRALSACSATPQG